MLKRRHFLTIAATIPAAIPLTSTAHAAPASALIKATLYRNPNCGCCGAYARYLDKNGFDVTLQSTNDLAGVNRQFGISEEVAGCHVMVLQKGYVVGGLVPLSAIRKLLAEHPDIRGISLPGMPSGAPGMTGAKAGPFTIVAIRKNGTTYVFDTV